MDEKKIDTFVGEEVWGEEEGRKEEEREEREEKRSVILSRRRGHLPTVHRITGVSKKGVYVLKEGDVFLSFQKGKMLGRYSSRVAATYSAGSE